MAAMNNVLENLKAWPMSKKTAFFAVIIVGVAGMMLLFSWMQKADYQVLYSNLSEEDAGSIVQELRSQNIPYQLGNGTVMVPSDQVYELRLQLASQGLPQGAGVGFEIFDNTSFTTSEFVQKLNFRRALEGELARTISSLAGVQQCRVHLAVPDRSVFAFQQDKPEATAAVMLSLSAGRKLSRGEVEGIIHMVSSSVEDLGVNSITVVDNKGNLLSRPGDDSVMSLSTSQMEYQYNFEKNMATNVVNILEPVVGSGKIKAKISSAFDFTRSERTEEIFDPEGVVVRSEQLSKERSTSGSPGGIPGVAANLPGGNAGNYASGGETERQDEMINYETSKTVRRVVESPVTLERMTVAILIDGIMPGQAESVENAEQYTVRSEDEIKYYEDIVKKTIGFSEDRGDEISVTVMPFKQMDTAEMTEVEQDYMPMVLTILKYLVPAIVGILFLIMILRPLIKMVSSMPSTPPRASARPGEEEIAQSMKPKEIPLEKQVLEWATQNPQQAAGIVKGWLEEK